MQLKISQYTKPGDDPGEAGGREPARGSGNIVALPKVDLCGQREDPEGADGKIVFDPDQVFYEAPSSKFYVGVGGSFRVYSRRTPVVNGVADHLRANEDDGNHAVQLAKRRVNEIEISQAVDWAGSLAGHKPGIINLRGSTLLVTDGPQLVEPVAGEFPVIGRILDEALGDGLPRQVFEAWLSIGLKAVRAGRHSPGQMMCLAGLVNTGKSLLAKLCCAVLGGRMSNPHSAWTGALVWNDDIVGSELLVIDDCESSTDIRSRRELAARFKEAIYSSEVQLRKRYASSMSVRPVWRVMVCCNDNPEALQIIPPIDDDLADKVILLRVNRITPPVDTSTQEGKQKFWSLIESELPALTDHLLRLEVPEALKDSRAGVIAYRDPDLEEAVIELSPERVLEELLVRMFSAGHLDAHPGESVEVSASELQEKMTDRDSPVVGQARTLFGRWSSACGVYLGKLARQRPELVRKSGTVNGIQKWELICPGQAEGVDM